MLLVITFCSGLLVFLIVSTLLTGIYTVRPTERAVLTSFGRAVRLPSTRRPGSTPPEGGRLYQYPQLKVIEPGGPYLKWPWQAVHRVNVATQAVELTWDPTKEQNTIEAVTKDNLKIGIRGQLRYRVSGQNLYAYIFGVRSPLEHVMGYFISLLRERVARFTDPKGEEASGKDAHLGGGESVSINDLRKNLPNLNLFMEEQCQETARRYGVELDAALITEIEPPLPVEQALAAINSTRNQVAADVSSAYAEADQQTMMAKQVVQIAKYDAEAEVAPLRLMADTLLQLKATGGSGALRAYLREMKLPLLSKAKRIVMRMDAVEKL